MEEQILRFHKIHIHRQLGAEGQQFIDPSGPGQAEFLGQSPQTLFQDVGYQPARRIVF